MTVLKITVPVRAPTFEDHKCIADSRVIACPLRDGKHRGHALFRRTLPDYLEDWAKH